MFIFVSYSSIDRSLAQALNRELVALGHTVQTEHRDYRELVRWDAVFENITQCDVFILTVTPNTLASYARLIEYNFALRLSKPVIPVRLSDVDVTALPEGIDFLVDYDPQNSLASEELDRVLSIVKPSAKKQASSAAPFYPAAEITDALDQVHAWITTGPKSPSEKAAIDINLRDLLERAETHADAEALAAAFAAKLGTRPLITPKPLPLHPPRQVTQPPRRRRGLVPILAVLLILLVGAGAFLFLRGNHLTDLNVVLLPTSATQIAGVPSQAATDVSLTPVLTETPPATSTSLPVVPIVPTQTSTLAPSVTPTVLVPSPDATATSTPFLSPTPSATDVPVVIPTNTLTLTATNVPTLTETSTAAPTLTSTLAPTLPPTLTSTRTSVPTLPPTNTPTTRPSETPSPTYTASPTYTRTPTATATLRATVKPLATLAVLASPSPTVNFSSLPRAVYVGVTVEDSAQGVKIVLAGASAIAGGVRAGDYVLAVDLNEVTSAADFYKAMGTYSVFSTATLRLRRGTGIVLALVNLGISDYAVPTATPRP